jgi:hypothetical protein
MADLIEMIADILSFSIFFHLNMSKILCCTASRPIDTGLIIIIHNIGCRHKNMFHLEKIK